MHLREAELEDAGQEHAVDGEPYRLARVARSGQDHFRKLLRTGAAGTDADLSVQVHGHRLVVLVLTGQTGQRPGQERRILRGDLPVGSSRRSFGMA